jgi:hypothetical protein
MMDSSDEALGEVVALIDAEDVLYLRELAGKYNLELRESKPLGIEPVSTIAIILLGSILAINAVGRLLEEHKGGQVVDLRPGRRKVLSRSRDVQYGLIVVLAKDGTVTLRSNNVADKTGAILGVLGELAKQRDGAGIDAIAKAAGDQLGVDAQVATGQNEIGEPS